MAAICSLMELICEFLNLKLTRFAMSRADMGTIVS
jgi:hypothetical protein